MERSSFTARGKVDPLLHWLLILMLVAASLMAVASVVDLGLQLPIELE
jgi:hypothetical protein